MVHMLRAHAVVSTLWLCSVSHAIVSTLWQHSSCHVHDHDHSAFVYALSKRMQRTDLEADSNDDDTHDED